MRLHLFTIAILTCLTSLAAGREYHVSVQGDDVHDGSPAAPLRTISAAAQLAMPGDVITVHEGAYRERIAPPRGGASDEQRIVYQAAPGEKGVLKGSERVTGWKRLDHDTWTVTLPAEFFGAFNPFADLIRGDWFNPKGRPHHTGAVYLNEHWLTEAASLDDVVKPVAPGNDAPRWFARVHDDGATTIWAQFKGVDPNDAEQLVEVNVRRAVFYPDHPGVNYLTVRGFTMMHAATNWAPPTAEQVGLIGTHWSRGWIIEHNDIRYSACVGVTLGKYGDKHDNTSQNSAAGYVETIRRATEEAGWSRENIGHHIVRRNTIAHCEQAGLVGSLGAVFSSITDNHIHDIHVRRLFTGAEMAGIKIHAAIDTTIARNRIHRTVRAIWLDWMAQGTRVTANLLYGNDEDLFVEVNHGPFMVDHNVLLSPRSLRDWSQGGAYVHNLFAGRLEPRPELRRETPYHKPHSTEVAGLHNIPGGDDRFYNNLFVAPADLSAYNNDAQPIDAAGNVYLLGARPAARLNSPKSAGESSPLVLLDFDPALKLNESPDAVTLSVTLDPAWSKQPRPLITTALLGHTEISGLPFEQPDASPYRMTTDYFNTPRHASNPAPGPFENLHMTTPLTIWPPQQ
jgi:alpha-N-arabinofuranosidase